MVRERRGLSVEALTAGYSQQTVAGGLGVVSGHSVQFSGQQGVHALGMTG